MSTTMFGATPETRALWDRVYRDTAAAMAQKQMDELRLMMFGKRPRLAPRWQVPAIRYTQACKRLGGAPPHFMETPWKSWSALKARMTAS